MKTPLRVLIVEDSEDDTCLLIETIRAGGYDPIFKQVKTADELSESFDREEWEVIIADYSMPRFSGLEALRLVKERGLDIPFILVSGTIGEEMAVMSIRAGAHDYVMKNNLTRLVPAIERELHDYQRRKKAEAYLKESEDRFHTIFENAADGILIAERESRVFIDANRKLCEMLGYPREELLKLGMNNIHPEEALPFVREQFDKQARGDINLSREIPIRKKDGSVFYADITTSLIAFSGKTYMAGFFRDVTELKQTKEELEKHHLHLEQLVRERTENLNKIVKAMAGREVRMSELKNVIRKLRAQLSQAGIEPEVNDPLLSD